MKKINIFIIGLSLVAVWTSCQKELQEINTNPNQLNDSRPEFLFTNATLNFNLEGRSQLSTRYSSVMRYMQYIVSDGADKEGLESPYWDASETAGPNPGFNYYADYYNGDGRDLHRIIEKIDMMDEAQQASYANIKAICRILDTYQAWRVADVYGAMPYSQAFNPVEFPLPAYDYDFGLYQVFDTQLKESAAVLMANSPNQVNLARQDFFYGGDTGKWLRFANTLRIKIAQRYEERDPDQLASVLNDIEANFDGQIISANEESFGYSHPRDWNNNVDDINVILFEYNAAYPFVEFLKSTADPRIAFMVRKNDFGTEFSGYTNVQQNGDAAAKAALLEPENQVRYWGKHVFSASREPEYGATGADRFKTFTVEGGTQDLGFLSAIQSRLFVKNGGFGGFDSRSSRDLMHSDETYVDGSTIKMRMPYLSYAETCFMMAEIAAKGGNGLGKGASQWYNDGVTASFEHYKTIGVATNIPGAASVELGDFLSRYPYNGLTSIYSQAWVHFLIQPEEAWAMWKRTGYPQSVDFRSGQPSPIGDGSGIAYLENLWTGSQNLVVPRRMPLPEPQDQNRENFNKAIQDMTEKDAAYGVSTNDTKGRIWWDAN
ncbi:SusD-like starch-binding protein associating with outer membrane [Anseongella ginsenosidimutans]|uniref:SusD-like starch-binding protein associating with outer membrane n=1 Tax=Anseongella ginsenosidimutans TaxID=496056 RepID=A0A4R3KMQ9_9SPHI|nr:SusD/RagB family nutrient-binding outer membrane lipoprotein [Anseongella ginsenosidimutans]QEC52040.1 SusD/RagB family nutrient-binding outer membrane lipoprotein [Anseongella ginsenosidimutans]TCS85652.1 SusD-like starch-binding protein associating with outer membrane [Anseongella ginsenosidimutans]